MNQHDPILSAAAVLIVFGGLGAIAGLITLGFYAVEIWPRRRLVRRLIEERVPAAEIEDIMRLWDAGPLKPTDPRVTTHAKRPRPDDTAFRAQDSRGILS